MSGPQVDTVPPVDQFPAEAEVVIVGGGIIGTSTALFLAQRGVSVVLCEKGHIAGEQSSRNWGWVRKTRRDPREIPLIIESLRLWERMNETVEAETGFRTTGILFAAETDEDVTRCETWLEYARPYQLDAKLISGAELDAVMPGGSKMWKAALYSASDGRAEPQKAAPAVALAARRAGAVILTDCAVRGVERTGGRVSGAVTERGTIKCKSLVVAGGCLVAALRQRSGPPAAAVEGAGQRGADRSAGRRTGNGAVVQGRGIPKTSGRRLHDRQWLCQCGTDHARQLPLLQRFPAGDEDGLGSPQASPGQPLHSGMAGGGPGAAGPDLPL